MSTLAIRMQAAADRARQLVDEYLVAFGALSEWRRRTPATGATEGAMSAAAGIADPADAGWTTRVDDPLIYQPAGQVRVAFDLPGNAQAEAVGMMITGTSFGYCSTADAVAAGDVLIVDGQLLHVDGARLASPPIYRQLTLRRA